MTFLHLDAVRLMLIIPAAAAAILALLPGYRLSARVNALAALATFVVSAQMQEWPKHLPHAHQMSCLLFASKLCARRV